MGLLDRIELNPEDSSAKDVKIETDLDKAYYEVLKNKRIEIRKLAEKLKVPIEKAEEWAKLLDKQGLVSIHYPAIGHAEARAVENKKRKKEKNKNPFLRLLIFAFIAILIVFGLIFAVIRVYS